MARKRGMAAVEGWGRENGVDVGMTGKDPEFPTHTATPPHSAFQNDCHNAVFGKPLLLPNLCFILDAYLN